MGRLCTRGAFLRASVGRRSAHLEEGIVRLCLRSRVARDFVARPVLAALYVAPSGYYAAQQRAPSGHAVSDAELRMHVRAQFRASHDTTARRTCIRSSTPGQRAAKKRVARVMHEEGLVARTSPRRRFVVTTNCARADSVARNWLRRWLDIEALLTLGGIDTVWARDIMYIPTPPRLSLSRRRLGSRHSYASSTYQTRLAGQGITCSISRKGNCWDNAVVESFFATLEHELLAKHLVCLASRRPPRHFRVHRSLVQRQRRPRASATSVRRST
jgi:transposase InsO family protein